jgi:hypothetical protein
MEAIAYFESLGKNAPFVTLAVLGLATFYGKAGLSGRMQLLAAFGTGLLVGGAFQVASLGVPADFAGWFYVGLTAVLMGLMPSGVYEAVKVASAHAKK